MAFKLDDKDNPLKDNPLFKSAQSKKNNKGRPKKDDIVRGVSVQEGLTKDYRRATFIMKTDLVNKIKDYAFTERITYKDAINMLLTSALEQEEKRLAKEGRSILQRKGD